MQSSDRTLYIRTQVIHGCRRSGVSALVRWYTIEMQSFNRTLVHNDTGHSLLSEKWSYYASDTVIIRIVNTVVLVNTVSTVVLMNKQKTNEIFPKTGSIC